VACCAGADTGERLTDMSKISVVLYILVMVAIIVGVDVLLFRNHFWARLLVNIGIVLVFGAIYLRFLKNP
jgi:hypothetical protein